MGNNSETQQKAWTIWQAGTIWKIFSVMFTVLVAVSGNLCYFWEGARHSDGMCYKLFSDTTLSWNDAQEFCTKETHTGRLAEPLTSTARNFVVGLATGLGNPEDIWLGGILNDARDSYVWARSRVAVPSNVWTPPSGISQTGNGDTCVEVDSQLNITADLCTQTKAFICEQSITVNPCYFWEEATYFKGRCYKIINSPLSWQNAQDRCKAETNTGTTRLAEPNTEDRIRFVRQMVTLIDQDFWIGGVLDLISGTMVWSSTREVINTTSWDAGEPNGLSSERCVMIYKVEWRLLHNIFCHHATWSVCEQDIGDLCENVLPGGDYFAGSCVKFHNTRENWAEAKESCSNQSSILAEPRTEDVFRHLQEYLFRESEFVLKAPRNSPYLNLKDLGLEISGTYIRFYLTACQDAQIALWESQGGLYENVAGPGRKYYEIILDSGNSKRSYLKQCRGVASNCVELDSSNVVDLECDERTRFRINWKSGDTLSVDGARLEHKLTSQGQTFSNIDRMAVSMGDSTGTWLIEVGGWPSILIAASDSDEEGVFRWESDKEKVTSGSYLPGEPNDYMNEYHLAISGIEMLYNDINASYHKLNYVCQRDAFLYTYVAVLPGSDSITGRESFLHVTTGHQEFAYLDVTHRMGGTVRKTWNIVTRDIKLEMKLDVDSLEIKETGKQTASLLIRTNRPVTIIMINHVPADPHTSSLIPEIGPMFTSYFILSHAAPDYGSQVIITAVHKDTHVFFRLPYTANTGLLIEMDGFSFRQPRFGDVTLDEGESFSLKCAGDFSGGFIYATQPVAVYVGSHKLRIPDGHTRGVVCIDITDRSHSIRSAPLFLLDMKYKKRFASIAVRSGAERIGCCGQGANANSDPTMDAAIPLHAMTSEYVIYPNFAPVVGETNQVRVLAIYSNTTVTVHGPTLQQIFLSSTGEVREITLPDTDEFYYIVGDLPFYALKVAGTQSRACAAPLLPSTLWRTEYNFDPFGNTQRILVAIPTIHEATLRLNNQPAGFTCVQLSGTDLSGCHILPGNPRVSQVHHLSSSVAGLTFAAYGSSSFFSTTIYCHPLGMESVFRAEALLQNFPSMTYWNQPDCESENVTIDITTMPPMTTDQELTTQQNTTSSEVTTDPNSLTTDSTQDLSYTTTDQPITSQQTDTDSTSIITQTPPNSLPSSPITCNVSKLHEQIANLTTEEINEISRKIIQELVIDAKNTSAFKRSKTSIVDTRASSSAIGMLGIALLVVWGMIMFASDFLTFLQFIIRTKNKSGSENVGL